MSGALQTNTDDSSTFGTFDQGTFWEQDYQFTSSHASAYYHPESVTPYSQSGIERTETIVQLSPLQATIERTAIRLHILNEVTSPTIDEVD